MKIAIVKVTSAFFAGVQGYAKVVKDEHVLEALRLIEGDVEQVDIRLYQLEEEQDICGWTECFITDKLFEVRGFQPRGYSFLCAITPYIQGLL